jgi:DNA-binding Xre family transcriptional regulator
MELINIKDEIKIRLIKMKSNTSCLAGSIGETRQNFNQKMKRGNFRTSELIKICKFLGCTPNDLLIK